MEFEKNPLESAMMKIHSENIDEWTTNFALNLNQIWNENSARDLDPSPTESFIKNGKSTIVIGKGPSIKKHNHLKILEESNFTGNILCCDGKLSDVLEAGITPDKFPNFYVATIDPYENIVKCYNHQIVNEFGSKIKGIFTTITNPKAAQRARDAGIQMHWIHSLFDYHEGEKSFNQITAKITRAKNHTQGLPAIQTGGNVGTSSWFLGWRILKSPTVVLVGINHGWEEDDPWETISSHGRNEITGNSDNPEISKKFFQRIFNPELKTFCIVDPIFQFYRNALIEFIQRSPSWLNTINATEGGSIFGDRIISMKLTEFLENHHN